MSEKFPTYKGYPLVRHGKELYYGHMADPYVIWLQIQDTRELEGEEIASKFQIILMDTNEPNPMLAIKKNAVFDCGLYEALDIAGVWLEKALKN